MDAIAEFIKRLCSRRKNEPPIVIKVYAQHYTEDETDPMATSRNQEEQRGERRKPPGERKNHVMRTVGSEDTGAAALPVSDPRQNHSPAAGQSTRTLKFFN